MLTSLGELCLDGTELSGTIRPSFDRDFNFNDHMSRRVIGEIQLLLARFCFSASDNYKLRLACCCSPGTIPPDIGKLVKLTDLRLDSTKKIEGETKIRVTVITCPGG